MTRDPIEHLRAIFAEHTRVTERTCEELATLVAELADAIWRSLSSGGKLVVFGNGGSAADAQHFAAELTGRFEVQRGPLAAIALSAGTPAITAIANDFAYAEVFARQVTALCRAEDIVVGISTTGRSPSVLRGMEAAAAAGASTWALTGQAGLHSHPELAKSIAIPAGETARVQETHITIIHAICALIDDHFR